MFARRSRPGDVCHVLRRGEEISVIDVDLRRKSGTGTDAWKYKYVHVICVFNISQGRDQRQKTKRTKSLIDVLQSTILSKF
jgi:hypothetical protein